MHVVIFCGGFGTRMWPASRKSFPKQFYPLIGGKSFFELTYHRFRKAFKPSDIFTSAEDKYTPLIRKQAPEIPKENIIEEPERRDNLGAIGLVAFALEKRFPGDVMIFSWSDHLFEKEDEFMKAILVAGEYAKESGYDVSLGEEPSYPSVHNGWVKLGKTIDEFKGYPIVEVERLIEKPEEEVAKRMFISGGYLLNTGYKAIKTDVMLGYYKELQPEIYQGLTKIMEAEGKSYKDTILYREYHKFKKDSIEKGIFEKIKGDKRVIIPTKVGWKDAGTWELLYKALKGKENNVNAGEGDVEFMDSKGNLVISQKGKVAGIIGVSGLVVVDTPDGLLVCDMKETSKVKELFAILESTKPKFVD